MKLYSFTDFKYICYVEGKKRAVEKIFSGLLETKKLKALCMRVEKNDINLNTIYKEYMEHLNFKNG
ncbi:hypothetical protein FG285_02280 [Listeria monocytogenes]|nr:hypothetical protein [Listeria monocytogenes]EAW7127308.1 hypothetical protein [Listeria monocytogenes]EAW7192023.1 hypothetical protein [Listeria monocytogenes]ECL0028383.1 hypothetical protein [Listeria monocytogenes]EDH0848839.1 hypothetical protein [Listeria monocytogenes]